MAAPVLQTSTTSAGATSASVAVTYPASIAANDIVIVSIYKENANAVTPPAGFSEIPTAPTTTAVQAQHTFWYRAAGGETGTVTFSWTGSVFHAAAAHRISGCTTSGNPYENTLSAPSTNSSNTSVATLNVSIASTSANTLLYWAGTDFTGGNVWTVPGGFGNLTDLDVLGDAFKTNAAGGATGNVTGTANISGPMTAILLSLISTPPIATGPPIGQLDMPQRVVTLVSNAGWRNAGHSR